MRSYQNARPSRWRSRWTVASLALVLAAPLTVALTTGLGASSAQAAGVAGSAPPVTCTGNGSDGNRVHVVYVHEPGNDRFPLREPSIRQALWEAQVNINDSARRDGAQRWLRFLHNNATSNCQVSISRVQVPAGTMSRAAQGGEAYKEYNATVATALGTDAWNRIYLLLGEGYPGCGDTDPGPVVNTEPGRANVNNSYPIRARAGFDCTGGHIVTHELTHALGAMAGSAPHAVRGSHCTDGQDILCQNTNPLACPDPLATRILDCGRDDYFGVVPRGSYLPTHWNIANDSAYLDAGASTPAITAIPPVPPQYLSATNISGTSVALSFRRPTSAWEAVTDYQVMNGSTELAVIPANEYRGTVVLTGLSQQRTYTLTVRSRALVNGVNRVSASSRPLTFTTGTSTSTPAAAPADGAVMVLTNDAVGPAGRNHALELFFSSLNEDAGMVLYQRNEGPPQQWRLRANSGSYNLVNVWSNKCLSVRNRSNQPDALVVQYTCAGTDTAQRWQFTSLSGGRYQLRNVLSGLCVQSQAGSTAEFTALVQSSCSTSQTTQRWSTNRLS